MHGVIMLTWFAHRRTSGICDRLRLPLFVLDTKRAGVLRIAELGVRTTRLLLHERPGVVVMQNPSLAGTLLVVFLQLLFRYRVVVDAHNEAVQPFVNRSRVVGIISKWILRRADITIVTNAGLADLVSAAGGTPFVLPDPIPLPEQARSEPQDVVPSDPSVMVIATGAPDEPIEDIANAAQRLPDVRFHVTGKSVAIRNALVSDLPENMELTGFVDEATYWSLLRNSDLVLDLTKMDDCLVCGAYEAVAVGTPMVLTDNRASRELFGHVACLVQNEAESIARGISQSLEQLGSLRARMPEYRAEYVQEWQATGDDLRDRLAQLRDR